MYEDFYSDSDSDGFEVTSGPASDYHVIAVAVSAPVSASSLASGPPAIGRGITTTNHQTSTNTETHHPLQRQGFGRGMTVSQPNYHGNNTWNRGASSSAHINQSQDSYSNCNQGHDSYGRGLSHKFGSGSHAHSPQYSSKPYKSHGRGLSVQAESLHSRQGKHDTWTPGVRANPGQWPAQSRGRGVWQKSSQSPQTKAESCSTFVGAQTVDTGVEIWASSQQETNPRSVVNHWDDDGTDQVLTHSVANDAKGEDNTDKIDAISEWKPEVIPGVYKLKPKENKPFEAKVLVPTVKQQVDSSIKESDTAMWAAKILASNPAQPSFESMKKISSQLEHMWQDDSNKDRTNISRYLSHQFSNSVNPYVLLIHILQSAADTHVPKTTTLAFWVFKEFEKFCKQNNSRLSVDTYVSKQMQMEIFNLCTVKHMTMFELAVRCFGLCYPGNDQFLPAVRSFVENKKFKEAAVCVGRLGLQHHFQMHEIVLPLLLQDKVNLVETYVCGFPDHQRILVQYLDHLCDRETDLDLVVRSVSHLPGVRPSRAQRKPLSKLAVRLMKLYKIPQDLCPNIFKTRGCGALRYLLHKRYIEKSMGSGSWEEMIQGAVGDHSYLKEHLVEQLCLYNDVSEALKWADYYSLDDSVIPDTVRSAREEIKSRPESQQHQSPTVGITGTATGVTWGVSGTAMAATLEVPGTASSGTWGVPGTASVSGEDWDSACFTEEEIKAAYHQLSIPLESVHLIDTLEAYSQCLEHITQPGSVVGIDSEWKPAFMGQIQKVALLQLALRDRVYLLDLLALDQLFTEATWSQFAARFLCSEHVLKLGYGIESDLKMLLRSFPCLQEPMMNVKRIVNLETLVRQLKLKESPAVFLVENDDSDLVYRPEPEGQGDGEGQERGLSDVVKRCMGRPLDKSEQMSNWERRPLRTEQVKYAALDAYVLLDLYDVLIKLAQEQGEDIDLEPSISKKWLRPSKNEKKRAKQRGDHRQKPARKLPTKPRPFSGQPCSPGDLRVVVDTMLQGLGRQLRSCGVDVHIMDPYVEHSQAIEVSHRENRVILSSGLPYHMISANVGPDMCYNVMCDKAKDQVVEVLNHFNVQVKQSDIFSRCQICNGNVYATIPSEDMKLLSQRKLQIIAQHSEALHSSSELGLNGGREGSSTYGVGSQSNDCSEEMVSRFIEYNIDWCTATILSTSASVQTETVPPSMFDKVEKFFCCQQCGKVFWEGSHFERVCDQFSHVLKAQKDETTIYDKLNANFGVNSL
ncbi:hypothetical protein DPMN_148972 [Dreissena polymorpha]|uniref:3'-5' exonuclease domain-containing protein n=2 Tax=Dreissena polymorpha TaxID=45954 RepID=A0A9D4FGK4_DREPO|nr:hypothetical protein DPMN_148972 [Dreissena polymorpha]